MNNEFKFGEYEFSYDGKFYKIKDICSENDFWSLKKVDRAIIKRSGITKLCKYFDFIESDFNLSSLDITESKIISAKVYFKDLKRGLTFVGDGEASDENLDSGIGKKYPMAMALKRARSRAIINYLGLDFYSEDEAEEFKSVSESSLTEDQIKDLAGKYSKNLLVTMAFNKAKESGMQDDEIKKFSRWVMNKPENVPMQLSDLQMSDIWNIITALEIKISFPEDTDMLASFVQSKKS